MKNIETPKIEPMSARKSNISVKQLLKVLSLGGELNSSSVARYTRARQVK